MVHIWAKHHYQTIVAAAKEYGTCTAVLLHANVWDMDSCRKPAGHADAIHEGLDWNWTDDDPNAIDPVKN